MEWVGLLLSLFKFTFFWGNGLERELGTRLLPHKTARGYCYSLILYLYYEVILLLLDLKSILVFFSYICENEMLKDLA